jgi:SAM-dependent methyltransferase
VAYDPTIYSGAARYYAAGRPAYSRALPAMVAAALGLDGRGRLVDVGCGPGILTLLLADRFDDAIGLDPDADMLAQGAQRAEQAGVRNVRWLRARAEELADLDLGPLRVATFGQSFHWTERERVAELVYDRLEPGGAIVLIAHDVAARPVPDGPGVPPIPHDEIHAVIDRHLGRRRRAGQGFPPPPMDRYEVVLARTRFGPPEHLYAPGRTDIVQDADGVLANYLSTSFAAPHLFGDRVDDFERDVRAVLAAASPDGRFWDWPGDTSIVIGRKS